MEKSFFMGSLRLLTIPVSSVDCERGVNKQNLIKTKLQARLKTDNLSTLMKMSLDTTDIDILISTERLLNGIQ